MLAKAGSEEPVIKAFPGYKPCAENADKYFNEIRFDNSSVEKERLKDSIAGINIFEVFVCKLLAVHLCNDESNMNVLCHFITGISE